jgi:hypothetical protein
MFRFEPDGRVDLQLAEYFVQGIATAQLEDDAGVQPDLAFGGVSLDYWFVDAGGEERGVGEEEEGGGDQESCGVGGVGEAAARPLSERTGKYPPKSEREVSQGRWK